MLNHLLILLRLRRRHDEVVSLRFRDDAKRNARNRHVLLREPSAAIMHRWIIRALRQRALHERVEAIIELKRQRLEIGLRCGLLVFG